MDIQCDWNYLISCLFIVPSGCPYGGHTLMAVRYVSEMVHDTGRNPKCSDTGLGLTSHPKDYS